MNTYSFDALIVGGGMTGICAAIASARNGAKTALVHDRPVLGGNASSEIRMHVCGANANMKKPELTEGGIAEGNRTIAAEKSPFWSKYPFVAWNT